MVLVLLDDELIFQTFPSYSRKGCLDDRLYVSDNQAWKNVSTKTRVTNIVYTGLGKTTNLMFQQLEDLSCES